MDYDNDGRYMILDQLGKPMNPIVWIKGVPYEPYENPLKKRMV